MNIDLIEKWFHKKVRSAACAGDLTDWWEYRLPILVRGG